MITEDYVSFETAKILKEKGFSSRTCKNSTCYGYNANGQFFGTSWNSEYPASTLQTAMKWLEEKYGIFCDIRRHGNVDDGFTYSWNCEGKTGLSVGNGGGLNTAAEARESAIRYCLENLI